MKKKHCSLLSSRVLGLLGHHHNKIFNKRVLFSKQDGTECYEKQAENHSGKKIKEMKQSYYFCSHLNVLCRFKKI